ncbi:hypothetical protein [Sulfurimonas sp.]|jgi:hypothetical protein|uniref:hypothetical protein n=1 Tax=Sulfurimonas sp. TaxID=2022749 RepID=UPI0025EDF18A|nr:hypothetical protein [Sulfurimonas sp.]MCK9473637.1 hypothetical protein [Sulfurimonas sp.]
MKTTLIILLTIFLSNSLYADELEWVDEQIEAIKPPRKGIKITTVADPFIFLEKNRPQEKKGSKQTPATIKNAAPSKTDDTAKADEETSVKKSFALSTIINSSAMIDGDWYKVSDKINGYTLTDITKTTVTLKNGTKEITLSTVNKNQNLKFKNK